MSERKLPHQSSKLVSGQVWVLRGPSLAGTDSELSFSLGNFGHLKSWYGGWPYQYCKYDFEGQAHCLGGRLQGSPPHCSYIGASAWKDRQGQDAGFGTSPKYHGDQKRHFWAGCGCPSLFNRLR